jgi:hypothetical protein
MSVIILGIYVADNFIDFELKQAMSQAKNKTLKAIYKIKQRGTNELGRARNS